MQIVIDIPEEEWTRWIVDEEMDAIVLRDSLIKGIPLPKGHGRLIDADKEITGLKETKVVDEADKQSVRFAILEFEYAKPIIKADY